MVENSKDVEMEEKVKKVEEGSEKVEDCKRESKLKEYEDTLGY